MPANLSFSKIAYGKHVAQKHIPKIYMENENKYIILLEFVYFLIKFPKLEILGSAKSRNNCNFI